MEQLVDRCLRKAEALAHEMIVVTNDAEQALYVCTACRQSFVIEKRPANRGRQGPTKPHWLKVQPCRGAAPSPSHLRWVM